MPEPGVRVDGHDLVRGGEVDTTIEAVTTIARESPEAAGLVAAIVEHNARDRELMLPTWEMLKAAEERARALGWAEGYDAARAEIASRLFGWEEELP